MGEALPQLHPGTGHFSTELRALLQGTSVLGRMPVGGFCPSCPLAWTHSFPWKAPMGRLPHEKSERKEVGQVHQHTVY